jgi:hypothetical protein
MKEIVKNIVLIVLIQISFNSVYAQISGQKVTLYNWNLGISEDVKLAMQSADLKEIIKTGQHPFEKLLGDSCWSILIQELNAKGAKIQSKNTLKGKVMYTPYGFPFGGKKKAAKNISEGLLLKADIQISSPTTTKTSSTLIFKKEKKKIKPSVTAKIVILNKSLNKVADVKGKAKSKDKIVTEAKSLGFIIMDEKTIEDQPETLLSVIREAIKKAVDQLK